MTGQPKRRHNVRAQQQDAVHRAVANGPVGPAMAGPIIMPVFHFFFYFFFSGRTNNRASQFYFRIFCNTESP